MTVTMSATSLFQINSSVALQVPEMAWTPFTITVYCFETSTYFILEHIVTALLNGFFD